MEHLSVTNAQKCIFESVNKLDIETVRLEQSLGRVVAEDVRANRDSVVTNRRDTRQESDRQSARQTFRDRRLPE